MSSIPLLYSKIRLIFEAMLDLVAPPRKTDEAVRALTLERLQELGSGEPLPYREREVRALIWELKYRGNPKAAELGGALLAEELLAVAGESLGKPLLIPVPMHQDRRRERGWNQTELLCEAALLYLSDGTLSQKVHSQATSSRRSGPLGQVLPTPGGSLAPFDYAPNILARVRATPPQQGLPRFLRLKNIKNSMAVLETNRVADRVCVVVDDVTTTGATFKECERALKAAGAREVHCVALARS